MVEKIKELIDDLKKDFNDNEIILLVYHPYNECPMQERDTIAITYIFEKIRINRAIIILNGSGGLFEVGLTLAYIFRKNLEYFTVCVPNVCGSSLCLPFFKADKLLLDSKAKVTQVDPIFEFNGVPLRAIKFLHSENSEKKEIARKSFLYARYHVMKMLKEQPSLFDSKNVDFEDFGHTEAVVDTFMNQDEHYKEISYKDLQELNLKVELIKNSVIVDKCKLLIQECQKNLMDEKKRCMIVTTFKIREKEDEGNIVLID